MKTPTNRRRTDSGSTLVAVFWLIGVLGLLILGAAKFVALDTKWIVGLKGATMARNLAETGISIASHPSVTRGDPLLISGSPDGQSGYQVDLSWEESLIPLNHVLFYGRKDILRRLFVSWGVNPQEAASIVDALVDWADEDDLSSLNGAEADAYSAAGKFGFPYNRPFENLDEIEWVLGMEKVSILKPDWKQYFTLWSNGRIDLNEANGDIIGAALGIEDRKRLEEFASLRAGQDGIKGTTDDTLFNSVQQVLQFFGVGNDQNIQLLSVGGSTKRIVSLGSYLGHQVMISETRRGNDLLWRMEY